MTDSLSINPLHTDEFWNTMKAQIASVAHSDADYSTIDPSLESGLTAREFQILEMVAAGHSAKSAARALRLSHRTIEVHRARIREKTGASQMAHAVAIAFRNGWLS